MTKQQMKYTAALLGTLGISQRCWIARKYLNEWVVRSYNILLLRVEDSYFCLKTGSLFENLYTPVFPGVIIYFFNGYVVAREKIAGNHTAPLITSERYRSTINLWWTPENSTRECYCYKYSNG